MKKKGRIFIFILAALALAGGLLYATGAFKSLGIGPGSTLEDIRSRDPDPKVEALLQSMTLEEKAGQLFMGCFYNGTPTPETVEKYHLGSVLLFGASFKDTEKGTLIRQLKALTADCALPPLIAVDEEGGTVSRVGTSPAFRQSPFQSPRDLFAAGGMEAVIADAHEKNALLTELGIHLNLAPVCDISQDPADFMYARSLGQDAKTTAKYAKAMVAACREDNVGCALKHFPGYGNSADTHKGLAVDRRPMEQLTESDLVPFAAGIEAGAPAVLVSHNIVTAMDEERPASLSPAVHRVLRYDLGFDGVIITDDLSMGAIDGYFPDQDSAVMAIMAGNDLLCTGDVEVQYRAVLQAVKDGLISEARIDRSAERILKWKIALGLLDPADWQEEEKQ